VIGLPLATALAVLVGVSLGLLGGGGSILTMPILLYTLGLDGRAAIATSLVVVGVTSAAALVPHARRGNVDYRIGLAFAGAGSVGAFLAGYVAGLLPARLLLGGFVLLMIAAGVAMIRGPRERTVQVQGPRPAFTRILAAGLGAGVVTGLAGAGGGFIVVPALSLLGGLEMRRAVGTSLLVITINTLFGYLGHATHQVIDLGVVVALTTAAVVGSVLGGGLSGRLSPVALRRGFGMFVVGMAVWMGGRMI
jgi:hypothetical protein